MHASLFQSSDVLTLFPTPVWELQLPPATYQPINDGILALITELRAAERPLSDGLAWQSQRDLHRRPELAGLVECIDSAAERILRFLQVGRDGLLITGCWANRNPRGTGHRIHSHPNNFLSGVYYVRTPPGADRISFHDPRVQTAVVRPPVTALTALNVDLVVTRVREGRMLLFPAWLPHSVDPSEAAAERVSVSFNLMFAQFAETLGSRRSVEPRPDYTLFQIPAREPNRAHRPRPAAAESLPAEEAVRHRDAVAACHRPSPATGDPQTMARFEPPRKEVRKKPRLTLKERRAAKAAKHHEPEFAPFGHKHP